MAKDEANGNLFSEYRRLFISELERLEKERVSHNKRINKLETEQAILKTKAVVAGFIASGIFTFGLNYLSKLLK